MTERWNHTGKCPAIHPVTTRLRGFFVTRFSLFSSAPAGAAPVTKVTDGPKDGAYRPRLYHVTIEKEPEMKKLFAILAVCIPFAAQADDLQDRKQASVAVIKEFAGNLKAELESAMKEGGPGQAIDVCSNMAPHIAHLQSEKTGWRVARTSLKVRNPKNAPDAWETKVLKSFEERKAKGEAVDSLDFAEVVEQDGKRVFRFMKAIPTGEACLKCHGADIAEPVKAKLDGLYPTDQARGFQAGDIRGAFTITQPM